MKLTTPCHRCGWASEMTGHPTGPGRFTFEQWCGDLKTGRQHVIRSYVAFDSTWPLWRKWLVKLASTALRNSPPLQRPQSGSAGRTAKP